MTGIRRFESKVFRRIWRRGGEVQEASTYSVRLAHDGRREFVNLMTPSKEEAARRAARFYTVLKASGWDAAFATLGVEPQRLAVKRDTPTVGELVAAAERVAVHVKPVTLRQYAVALRWLAGLVAGIEGDESRFDYKRGGLERWRAQVDAVSLADMTPRSIESAVASWVKAKGATPEARRSAASLMRQARAFWSRKLSRLLPFESLPRPFEGVAIEQPRPPRYVAHFDSAALVEAARAELRDADPQAWLAFLLLLGAGLRKGEADALVWSNVSLDRAVVRITAGKTADSIGEVPIGPEAVAELAHAKAKATGLHVLEGDALVQTTRRTYRAERTFERLTRWLRQHGVDDRKPLHALRKEAGSLVNAVAGIHAASRFLRHGDIAVTAAHYADNRNRVVVPIFERREQREGSK